MECLGQLFEFVVIVIIISLARLLIIFFSELRQTFQLLSFLVV